MLSAAEDFFETTEGALPTRGASFSSSADLPPVFEPGRTSAVSFPSVATFFRFARRSSSLPEEGLFYPQFVSTLAYRCFGRKDGSLLSMARRLIACRRFRVGLMLLYNC